MDDLISRSAVLNGISDLMKSPWYNDGKDGERHVQYLARKDAVEVVKVLCVVKEPAVDAIPVEWLRQYQSRMPNTAAVMGVDVVLKMWQKEQREAEPWM